MAWLFRKAPVELVVSIHLDKNEVEAPGAITGHVELSNSGELVVDGISIQLVGYEGVLKKDNNYATLRFGHNIEQVLAKPDKPGGQIKLKAGIPRKLQFALAIPPGCHPPTVISQRGFVRYFVELLVNLGGSSISSTTKEVTVRVPTLPPPPPDSPSMTIKSRQNFLTHSPIDYSFKLHAQKWTYAPGETVPVHVTINNQSRMEVSRMQVEFVQSWTFHDRTTSEIVLFQTHVVEAPLFPVPSKLTNEAILEFPILLGIPPTIPRNSPTYPSGIKTCLLYYFKFVPLTSDNDRHEVRLPVSVIDPLCLANPTPLISSVLPPSALRIPTTGSVLPMHSSVTAPGLATSPLASAAFGTTTVGAGAATAAGVGIAGVGIAATAATAASVAASGSDPAYAPQYPYPDYLQQQPQLYPSLDLSQQQQQQQQAAPAMSGMPSTLPSSTFGTTGSAMPQPVFVSNAAPAGLTTMPGCVPTMPAGISPVFMPTTTSATMQQSYTSSYIATPLPSTSTAPSTFGATSVPLSSMPTTSQSAAPFTYGLPPSSSATPAYDMPSAATSASYDMPSSGSSSSRPGSVTSATGVSTDILTPGGDETPQYAQYSQYSQYAPSIPAGSSSSASASGVYQQSHDMPPSSTAASAAAYGGNYTDPSVTYLTPLPPNASTPMPWETSSSPYAWLYQAAQRDKQQQQQPQQ